MMRILSVAIVEIPLNIIPKQEIVITFLHVIIVYATHALLFLFMMNFAIDIKL